MKKYIYVYSFENLALVSKLVTKISKIAIPTIYSVMLLQDTKMLGKPWFWFDKNLELLWEGGWWLFLFFVFVFFSLPYQYQKQGDKYGKTKKQKTKNIAYCGLQNPLCDKTIES